MVNPKQDLYEALRRKSQLFAQINPNLLERWLSNCNSFKFKQDEVLIAQGELNQVLYLLTEGELDVHVNSEKSTTFATLKPGAVAGEVSLLSGRETSAWVSARTNGSVISISGHQLLQWAHDSHQFALNLLQLANTRLHDSNAVARSTQQTAQALEAQAMTDSLTGLLNRHWLEMNQSRLQGISVIAIDIDHFKQINDRHGHPAGDQVLKAVAETLRLGTRPHDAVMRLGGEEFAVVVDLSRTEATPEQLAERLRASVAELRLEITSHQSSFLKVQISLGVATQQAGETWEELIGRADQALYAAKQGGRNRVEVAGV